MAAIAISVWSLLSEPLSVHEALSGVFGSVSMATWIFLLVPQLVLNYNTGRADALSIKFLIVWFVGDIANLAGAVWAGLVPTIIALAIYFCIADIVLLSQTLYYNTINARVGRQASIASTNTENEPLLTRRRSSDTTGLPGSHRRRSSNRSNLHRSDSLSKILEEADSPDGNQWLKNTLSILGVIAAGTAGWAIAWQSGVWKATPEDGIDGEQPVALGANILGYISAVCYLGARLPQIYKNWSEKSCEGLSLLFFLLSLMGNATYGASILFHSLERDYIWTNLPWLIGSLGTMAEDIAIFIQFRMYAERSSTSAIE